MTRRYVHVAGFHPAIDSPNATGGFEWRYDREGARSMLLHWLNEDDEGHNLVLARVPVPAELDADGITDYLNDNLDLFECSP